MQKYDEIKKIRKITIFGLIINIFLAIIKIIFGLVGKSSSLVADGFHTISDFITDLAVIFGAKIWTKEADDNYPYGYSRFETIVTFFIIFCLSFVATGIFYNAVTSWIKGEYNHPSFYTFFIALISVIVKEYLYRKTAKASAEINSPAVLSNAWHHRSDAFSSIPVVIVILLCQISPKFAFFDYIGAIIVAFFIYRFVFNMLKNFYEEIMNKTAPRDYIEHLEKIIKSIKCVNSYHCLRTRKFGKGWFIDVHIQVEPNMTVSEGHLVAKCVKDELLKNGQQIFDVLVHIEPFN